MPLGLPRDDAVVEPYDPGWPVLFQHERNRIVAAIGHIVADIQHIGSTSIPGLPAKPILDIAVMLNDFEDGERCIEPLEKIGYIHGGLLDEIPGDRFFSRVRMPQDSAPTEKEVVTHHLHMYTLDSPLRVNHLVFRDYLITTPDEAAKYARLKLSLAGKHPSDRKSYSAGKRLIIAEVLAKATGEFE